MTDEMIQQVPQQRGSYAVPGLIGGAIVGGAAGAAGAHYKNWGITTKPDLDKVFAQTPDTFKKQIEKGGENKGAWETAQEWANKIKDANAEYDKKEAAIREANTVVLDKDVDAKLKEAQEKYNAALEAEKKSIAKTTGTRTDFKFPTAEEVKNLGSKVTLDEINTYDKLLKNYEAALKKAEASADRTAIEGFKSNVANNLEGLNTISKRPAGLFKSISKKVAFYNKVNDIKAEIETIYPDITDAKRIQHELKAAGKDYKPGTKKYNKFVDKLNEQVKADRKALFKEILGDEIKVDVIDPKTKKVIGKRVTYTNVEKFAHENESAANRLAKFEKRSDVQKLGGAKNLHTVEECDKALEALEKGKAKMTIGRYETTKQSIEAEKKLAAEYEKITASIQTRIDNFFDRISRTKLLEEKVQKAINNDPQVQSTLQRLKNFAEKNEALKEAAFKTTENAELTTEEIAAKAVENLKEQQVAKDLEALKAQAKEKGTELTEQGKKLLEELGSKDNYTAKVKEDAKKAVEPLLEKLKIANKTYTGLAAAAVIGLAGALIGASSKKD